MSKVRAVMMITSEPNVVAGALRTAAGTKAIERIDQEPGCLDGSFKLWLQSSPELETLFQLGNTVLVEISQIDEVLTVTPPSAEAVTDAADLLPEESMQPTPALLGVQASRPPVSDPNLLE